VTSQPRAFFALDFGAATTSVALVGHVGNRWRLIAHAAAPASVDVENLIAAQLSGVAAADPDLFAELSGRPSAPKKPDLATPAGTWTRLTAHSTPPRRIAILAGSRRQLRRLEEIALNAGWLVAGGSADEDDHVELSRLAFDGENTAVLLGADHSPGGDERRHLPDLAALVAAAARVRPELTVVLAGGAAAHELAFSEALDPRFAQTPDSGSLDPKLMQAPRTLLAPDGEAGNPSGAALQEVLEGLRAVRDDSRLGFARSIASLAYVLDRTIEGLEVGLDSGLRIRSEPYGQNHSVVVSSHVLLAGAAFAPIDPSEEVIDGVLSWSTISPPDRYRTTDRLRDFRISPWGEADGDGAIIRLAAAKAAVERLVEATPDISGCPMPDLIVAGGGVFASLPASIVALAMADLIRRPGVAELACDQARLLGPLGAIEDEAERRRLLANLADDLLVPVGSLVMPAGVKAGRSAGRLKLRGGAHDADIEMHPGAIQVLDLQAGLKARATIDFRDTVRLGSRGRHFEMDVAGGLGGLVVDLRDIPLRLPDRPEQRRAALEAWQRGMWPEFEE
jgi:hypothetical protein